MNKYLAEVKGDSKVLRGPVELPKPNDFDYMTNPGYNKRFEDHIASLPTIKAGWLTDIDNQKYFELGKDFTIHYDGYFEGVGESTAVPIDKQESDKPVTITPEFQMKFNEWLFREEAIRVKYAAYLGFTSYDEIPFNNKHAIEWVLSNVEIRSINNQQNNCDDIEVRNPKKWPPEKHGKYWCVIEGIPDALGMKLTILDYGEGYDGRVGFLSEDGGFKVLYYLVGNFSHIIEPRVDKQEGVTTNRFSQHILDAYNEGLEHAILKIKSCMISRTKMDLEDLAINESLEECIEKIQQLKIRS